MFSVTLTAQSRSTSLPTQVDQNADTALIEPWGVLQLGGSEFSGVEGRMVREPLGYSVTLGKYTLPL